MMLPNDLQNIVTEYITDCCIDGIFLNSGEVSDYLKSCKGNGKRKGRHIIVYKTLILSDIKLPHLIDIKYEYKGNVILKDDVSLMFSDSKFNGDISHWDVLNVKCMSYMFENSYFNGDISKWDVSNVEQMEHMFSDSQFNNDISKWDVSNVKNMSFMFSGSIFNNDISAWNTNNVKFMSFMFYVSQFNGDISSWEV
jgi:surface protein